MAKDYEIKAAVTIAAGKISEADNLEDQLEWIAYFLDVLEASLSWADCRKGVLPQKVKELCDKRIQLGWWSYER